MVMEFQEKLLKIRQWFVSGVSGKTSWEWMELLIIPMLLAFGVFYLEKQVERRQEDVTSERYELEARIAEDRTRQETLTSYFEQMKELLLSENLRESLDDSEVRSVARAITTTTVRELDGDRNVLLISFLQESNLIRVPEESENQAGTKSQSLLKGLRLGSADLSEANLSSADFSEADLGGADLIRTDLNGAALDGANLSYADLREADLSYANLKGANLRGADLSDMPLSSYLSGGADLQDANLQDANLRGADFQDANLQGANLRGADLQGADLQGANLRGADLRFAYLDESKSHLRRSFLCKTKLPGWVSLNPDRDCRK